MKFRSLCPKFHTNYLTNPLFYMKIRICTPKLRGLAMQRTDILRQIDFAFQVNPVVALLGPRQCGKTTCARQYIAQEGNIASQNYFDLENSRDLERLSDPLLTLSKLSGLIVIDEIQYVKSLFPSLRVLADDPTLTQQFLILGSASHELAESSSETLAGRISYLELTPFSYPEVGQLEPLWFRGGFPKSYLAKDDAISDAWRKAFILTFLERDIPRLGIKIPSENLRRFWMMLAHYHGKIFNASDIACSLGLSDKTVMHYLDILTGTFMVRQLKPWFENIGKRQIKRPKVYIRDSGILHTLLNIHSYSDLLVHPLLAHSWECFALEEIIRVNRVSAEDCYFWGVHQQAELDLLILKEGKRLGFEVKYTSSPKRSSAMNTIIKDLKLDKLTIIYPGHVDYFLEDNIEVVGVQNYLAETDEGPK